MQSGEIALGGLVVAGGDAAPRLQFVDQALDGVAVLVELGVVSEGPAAPAPLLLPVGGLVLLLRDDRLDATFVQVGTVASGGTPCLRRPRRAVCGDGRPGVGPAPCPARG